MQKQSFAFARLAAVLVPCLFLLLLFGRTEAGPVSAAGALPTATPASRIFMPVVGRNYDPFWQWQAPSPVLLPAPPLATNALPVSAIDRQGQVHLLWAINSLRPEGKFIYHSYLTATGWTTPTAILPTLGTSYNPAMPAVGPDGAVHLFWTNRLTSTSAPRLLYSAYRNAAWTPEEVAFDYSPYGTNIQTWGSAQIANNGQVYAIAQYVHLFLYTHQARRTEAGWPAKLVPDSEVPDAYEWILGDRDGAVRRLVTRYENGTYHGYYSRWLDGTFLTVDAPLPFVTRNTYGQLDAGNNLHVYWRAEVPVPGGQVMGLYHQCFDPAMTPAAAPELLTGQDATAASLLPAADEAGRWSLAWQMAATGEAKLGVWQGCQRQQTLSVPPDAATPWPPFQALFSRSPNRWCGVWKTGGGGYQVRCAEIAT